MGSYLPCPFCEQPKINVRILRRPDFYFGGQESFEYFASAECEECGARIARSGKTQREAIYNLVQAWNRRGR